MIERALGIEGWMSSEELTFLAEQAKTHTRVAEIGSWRGRSTAALADNTPGTVFAIDTWEGSKETDFDPGFQAGGAEWLWQEFLRNRADNVIPVIGASIAAAADFAAKGETFDMIFIDGAHDAESVAADLAAWRPLLAPGGLFCGHDFWPNPGWPEAPLSDVRRVVDSTLSVHIGAGSIWVANGGINHLLPCAILVPSLDRPQRLRDLVANIHATTPEEHFILFCVSDDESKTILDELEEWYIDDSDCEDRRYVTRMNKLVKWLDDAKTMFFGSDDVIHHQGWLGQALKVMSVGWDVVAVNDMHNMAGTQAVMRRSYLPKAVFDAPGLAFHPDYGHNFADNEQFFTAQRHNQFMRARDAVVEHKHPIYREPDGAAWDSTYEGATRTWDGDEARWKIRHAMVEQAVP